MTIKEPIQNRLVCSNCGSKTSYRTDDDLEVRCRVAMEQGAVFIAFCDFCEVLLHTTGGSFMLFQKPDAPTINFHYATGLPDHYSRVWGLAPDHG